MFLFILSFVFLNVKIPTALQRSSSAGMWNTVFHWPGGVMEIQTVLMVQMNGIAVSTADLFVSFL